MAEYVTVALETDPAALAEESFATLADRIEGWEAHPGEPDVITLEETAALAADVRDVASESSERIFRYFGETIANVPPLVARSAEVLSTWTAPNNLGYTIQEGWSVGIRVTGDELVLFSVQESVTIPAGSTATAAGAVRLVAQEETASANGIGGAGVLAELVEAVDVSFTIALTGLTADGSDEEDDLAYRTRLAEELSLQSPRPILPNDFAILSKRIAEVDRALAIDLYKPAGVPNPGDPAETNRARSVTVAVVKENGEAVSVAGRAAVDALLQSMREVNFEVWVIDPTYTTIDVTFEVAVYPGWVLSEVDARAETAVRDYLNPAEWGMIPFSDERVWLRDLYVRYGELYEVLNRVDGVWRVNFVRLARSGQAQAEANVLLDGVAPLPRAGTILGTAVAA